MAVIITDMEFPKRCLDCQLMGREKMYCQLYPRKDLNVIRVVSEKPEWCPLKEIDERNAEDCISKARVNKIIDSPYFRQADKLIQIMNLPSAYPKSEKPSGKCKDCGHYEKCTNFCSKNYLDKVFREPNWFCADFAMMESEDNNAEQTYSGRGVKIYKEEIEDIY